MHLLWLIFLPAMAYQLLSLAASLRQFLRAKPAGGFTPPVSVLKPVHGIDPGMYEAFVSQAQQDYPEFELLFGVADETDAAVPEMQRLQREFPDVHIRLFAGADPVANGKVGILLRLAREARHPIWVVNDSDIGVPPGYLREVVAPLADASVGGVGVAGGASVATGVISASEPEVGLASGANVVGGSGGVGLAATRGADVNVPAPSGGAVHAAAPSGAEVNVPGASGAGVRAASGAVHVSGTSGAGLRVASGAGIGLVTCLYRPRSHSLPAAWEALGIAVDFMPSTLVAPLVGVREFGLGSTLAFRAADFEQAGGFAAVADYLADDYQLARRITSLGKRALLSTCIVETSLGDTTWSGIWRHQLRWARTIRASKGGGYAGLPLTHAGLWAIGALACGLWPVAVSLAALRIAAALAAGWLVIRLDQPVWSAALAPLWDLYAFGIWLSSYASNEVRWRDHSLRIGAGGRILPAADPQAPRQAPHEG